MNELSEDFVYNYLYDHVSSFDFAIQTNMIDDRGMVKVWNHILSRFEGLGVMGQTFRMSSLVGEGLSYEKRYDFTWFTKGHGYGNIEIYGTGYQPEYETTVENIAASLLYHEWYSHGIRLYDDPYNHSQAFLNVIQSPLWRTTTYSYKYYNYDMYDYYKEIENALFDAYISKLKK